MSGYYRLFNLRHVRVDAIQNISAISLCLDEQNSWLATRGHTLEYEKSHFKKQLVFFRSLSYSGMGFDSYMRSKSNFDVD